MGGKLGVLGTPLATLNADLAGHPPSSSGELLPLLTHPYLAFAPTPSRFGQIPSIPTKSPLDQQHRKRHACSVHGFVRECGVRECDLLSLLCASDRSPLSLCCESTESGPPAASKSKRAAAAAATAAARAHTGLTAAQCATLDALLCSRHACVLPERLPSLSISNLCHLLSALSDFPDLLQRWTAALHALCCEFGSADGSAAGRVDWAALSEAVLQPALRKPLRVHCALTCLDLSWNVDTLVSVRRLVALAPLLFGKALLDTDVPRPVLERRHAGFGAPPDCCPGSATAWRPCPGHCPETGPCAAPEMRRLFGILGALQIYLPPATLSQ